MGQVRAGRKQDGRDNEERIGRKDTYWAIKQKLFDQTQ